MSGTQSDRGDDGDEGNRPSECQNPDADCYRDPDREVKWVEDYTAEDPHYQLWLCDPCYAMLTLGTAVSPNEVETRRGGFDGE